jgi:hypothetical protein
VVAVLEYLVLQVLEDLVVLQHRLLGAQRQAEQVTVV